jgi:hypothetical protein
VFSYFAPERAHRLIGQFGWSTFCFAARTARLTTPFLIGTGNRDGWPEISSCKGMPFSGANICAQLLFGSIGFVGFAYGRKMHAWKPMFIGIALMTCPYFLEDTTFLWASGIAGMAALIWFRD